MIAAALQQLSCLGDGVAGAQLFRLMDVSGRVANRLPDIASGVAIGLLPDLPPARFEQVGNAAGAGVRMMLASKAARRRAQQIAAEARYIELSTLPAFQKRFLHHIGFKASNP